MNARETRARTGVLLLGPHREAISGVSMHVNVLMASTLGTAHELRHFQVGSEGRRERPADRLARLAVSPVALALAIRASGASIVHLNTSLNARAFWRDLAYLLVARACGARVVYQVHGGALPRDFLGSGSAATGFLRHALALPDVVVVLASSELKAYREFVPEQRVIALPNGIDCAPYAALERVAPPARSPLRLAYVGRLARDKGIYEMLQAVRLARAHGTAVTLTIGGSGPEEAALARYAEELRLGSDVVFAGPVFGEGKLRLLARSDVFVLPSYSEGLPYALLEAMAAGLPVVTTPVGAIPDVVRNRVHGLFVPVRNAEAIARAIAALDADRALLARMGEECRRRIATAYSIDKLAAEFGRLYAELRLPVKALSRAGSTDAPG